MVRVLLRLNGTPQADAADALAVALCHAQLRSGQLGAGEFTQVRRGRRQ